MICCMAVMNRLMTKVIQTQFVLPYMLFRIMLST